MPEASRKTFIHILLDETGSMSGVKARQAIKGYNAFIKEQQSGEECFVTLTKWDSIGLKTPYRNLPATHVPELTSASFTPTGMTNLYDVLGESITEIMKSPEGNRIVVLITDGGENSSRIWSKDQIVSLMSDTSVVCLYLGADQAAEKIATELGFKAGNVRSFASAEFESTLADIGSAVKAFRAGNLTQDAILAKVGE
jgi:hypothetical protein